MRRGPPAPWAHVLCHMGSRSLAVVSEAPWEDPGRLKHLLGSVWKHHWLPAGLPRCQVLVRLCTLASSGDAWGTGGVHVGCGGSRVGLSVGSGHLSAQWQLGRAVWGSECVPGVHGLLGPGCPVRSVFGAESMPLDAPLHLGSASPGGAQRGWGPQRSGSLSRGDAVGPATSLPPAQVSLI